MAMVYGKNYTKKELLDRMGSIDGVAGIRQIQFQDGMARGMRAYEVTNGPMRFVAYIDKCLDIGELYYNGMPMHFLARPGVMSGEHWHDGPNAVRSIMGGMMFTCGLSNVGPLQEMPGGQTQPQHGFLRNMPAEHHGARTYWEGDDYYLELTATVRESSLFGVNLVLRRTITTKLGETSVRVRDEIENESSTDGVPLMLMYHCNAGFPLLDADARLEIDALSTAYRDETAQLGDKAESYRVFGEPVVGYSEQVFYHKVKADNHICAAKLVNPGKKLALTVRFDGRELPYLTHWKCKDAGNYVTGIEPSNCHPEGVHKEEADGTLRRLAAHERIETALEFEIGSC